MGRDGTEGCHVGVVEGCVVMFGEGAAELRVAVDYHYGASDQGDSGKDRTDVGVETGLFLVMRVETGVEDQGAVESEPADRVGTSAGGRNSARFEAGKDLTGHLPVGIHNQTGHPVVAKTIQKSEIFYKEEADFGVGGRPAGSDVGIVDYGADHACFLALDFHRLYNPGFPGPEGTVHKLLKGEEIICVVFHSF